MKINGIHHLNIRCSVSDLPAIEKFYDELLGFKKGYRPDFPNPGIWIYHNDHPILHVNARYPDGYVSRDVKNASVDHIAFAVTGAGEFRDRVRKLGLAFEEQNVPNAGYQIFLKDPMGTTLEFNFPNSEAPNDMASGTLAPRQTAPV